MTGNSPGTLGITIHFPIHLTHAHEINRQYLSFLGVTSVSLFVRLVGAQGTREALTSEMAIISTGGVLILRGCKTPVVTRLGRFITDLHIQRSIAPGSGAEINKRICSQAGLTLRIRDS